MLGSIEIDLAPFLKETFFSIFIILIGVLLVLIPAELIFSTNIFADPSRIGTSSESISINTLSIPLPNS